MRMINADALWTDIQMLPHNGDIISSEDVEQAIKDCPTIDPESLRPQGEWEDEYGAEYENSRYRCSVCKETALFKIDRDCLGGWHEVQALTPSYPNCGAKMKNGSDHNG